jgi:hypothetical protein
MRRDPHRVVGARPRLRINDKGLLVSTSFQYLPVFKSQIRINQYVSTAIGVRTLRLFTRVNAKRSPRGGFRKEVATIHGEAANNSVTTSSDH